MGDPCVIWQNFVEVQGEGTQIKGSTNRTFWVGFHLSEGNSPLCGSSTGGCSIEMHTSPFLKEDIKY